MSLLLDALKEAEKSRKGHRLEESRGESMRPQQEDPEVLDLDLVHEEDGNTSPTTAQPAAEPVSTELSPTEPSQTEPAPTEPPPIESAPTKHPATTADIKETEGTRTSTKATDAEAIDRDHLTPTPTPIPPIERPSASKPATAEPQVNTRVAAEVFQNRENKPSRPSSRLPLLLLLLVLVIMGLMVLYFLLMPKEDSSFVPSHQAAMMENDVSESEKFLESANTSTPAETASTKAIPAETITDTKVTDNQITFSAQGDQVAVNDTSQGKGKGNFTQESALPNNASQFSSSQNRTRQSSTDPAATPLQQLTRQSSDYSTEKPEETISSTQQENPEIKISKRQLSPRTSQTLAEANQALEQGNLNAAELSYRQILKQSPGNLAATSNLGHLLLQRGMTGEAERLYLQVLDQDPENLEAKIALININAADPTNLSAGSQLKQLLTEHPKHPYLHASLGNFYARRNDWSAAQSAYFEAFALENKNADYAYNLAISLDQLGKSDIAANYYEKALALHDNRPTQFNKSDVARRLTEIKGADQ